MCSLGLLVPTFRRTAAGCVIDDVLRCLQVSGGQLLFKDITYTGFHLSKCVTGMHRVKACDAMPHAQERHTTAHVTVLWRLCGVNGRRSNPVPSRSRRGAVAC